MSVCRDDRYFKGRGSVLEVFMVGLGFWPMGLSVYGCEQILVFKRWWCFGFRR